jgi:hypothetical protein
VATSANVKELHEISWTARQPKGYHYQFVLGAGHVSRAVQRQTMPEAFEWTWHGYWKINGVEPGPVMRKRLVCRHRHCQLAFHELEIFNSTKASIIS